MRKIIVPGLTAGVVLLIFSIIGLYLTIWLFPNVAMQYFDPVFDTRSGKFVFYCLHPFVISLALSWFWTRFKHVLTGSFITRGIEFALIYILIAIVPMMWLLYSTMNISAEMIATWFTLALIQAVIAGLVFEKMNP